MQLLSSLACAALALSSVVAASPIEARQAVPSKFHLKTKATTNTDTCGSNKTGLYITSYHTGAGLGIAAAAGGPSNETYFYLNGSSLLWDYTTDSIGGWNTILEYIPYASFQPIDISIADGPATDGFFVNSTGLQSNATNGWLVCDWAYSAPQLFYKSLGYASNYPATCSEVDLLVEPISS